MGERMNDMFSAIQLPEEYQEIYREALSGDINAMKEIADHLIYWNPKGEPTREESRVAKKFYRKAIRNRETSAMLNYGGMFRDGVGVQKNHVIAHFWYLMAVLAYKKAPWKDRSGYRALGNSWKYHYDEIGRPTSTKNRIRLLIAFFWFRLGAGEEEMNSLYELGDYYRDGIIVRRDLKKAFSLYMDALKAIEDGPCPENDDNLDDVALRLAQCYQIGIGTDKNLGKALEYAELAVNRYSEIVENGGTWDKKYLDEAKVLVTRICREAGLED